MSQIIKNMEKNKKPQNLNAFPTRTEYEDPTNPIYSGMTLRDYFAAKAMQSLIVNAEKWNYSSYSNIPKSVAKDSFILADEMLKQREL